MELKHTKGDWFVEFSNVLTAKRLIANCVGNAVSTTKEDIANAQLIAASPTMLEALLEVQKHMNAFIPEHVFDKVNNAIEKATANN